METGPQKDLSVPGRPAPLTFAERMLAEADQVTAGTEDPCGHICPGCHGGMACIRAAHGTDAVHVGKADSGDLVQWHGDCDEATHAAVRHAAAVSIDLAQRTRDLLAGIDPALLVQLLRDGGHL